LKNLHFTALKHLDAPEEGSARVSKSNAELIDSVSQSKYLHNYKGTSPVFVNSNSDKRVDSSERRAVTLNDKNMVTEEYNDNHYNIYDDPITLKELNKDQSPH